jgi:two-component system, OmpR family, phosphate regulon response regulator PhoB
MPFHIQILGNSPDLEQFIAHSLTQRGYTCALAPLSKASLTRNAQLLLVDLEPAPARRLEQSLALAAGLKTGARAGLPLFVLLPPQAGARSKAKIDKAWDDFMVKPFDMREFLLRVDTLIKRFYGPIEEVYEAGRITLDVDHHEVRAAGKTVKLTAKEFGLLTVLMQKTGRLLNRQYLLQAVWGVDAELSTRVVDMCVSRLRRKLGADGEAIETVTQYGYRFKAPGL